MAPNIARLIFFGFLSVGTLIKLNIRYSANNLVDHFGKEKYIIASLNSLPVRKKASKKVNKNKTLYNKSYYSII